MNEEMRESIRVHKTCDVRRLNVMYQWNYCVSAVVLGIRHADVGAGCYDGTALGQWQWNHAQSVPPPRQCDRGQRTRTGRPDTICRCRRSCAPFFYFPFQPPREYILCFVISPHIVFFYPAPLPLFFFYLRHIHTTHTYHTYWRMLLCQYWHEYARVCLWI